MSAPLMPSPLDYIGRRSFAFYPPIRHAHPNAWRLGAGSWSEVQVINAQTGAELWIPRQYIGAVGDNQNALVVGLTQDIQLRDGEIIPRSHRRLIQMPLPGPASSTARHSGPASVVGIRLENTGRPAFQNTHFRIGILVLFVAGLLALVASASR